MKNGFRYFIYFFTFCFLFCLIISPRRVEALTYPAIRIFSYGLSTYSCQNCTSTNISTYAPTDNIFLDFYSSYTSSLDYTYRFNVSLSSQLISPTLSNCGLLINGSYVSTSSITSSRVSYECSQYRCESSYFIQIEYNSSVSGLTSSGISCSVSPNTDVTRLAFNGSVTDGNGTLINSIEDTGQQIITNQNQNQQSNNSNRDYNTDRQINNSNSNHQSLLSKIQDFIESVEDGFDNVIQSIANAFTQHMNSLGLQLNSIISTITRMLNETIQSISNGFNKLIGSQEVCETVEDYYFSSNDVSLSNYILDSSGNLVSAPGYGVSDYLRVSSLGIVGTPSAAQLYSCFYDDSKSLISCVNTYQLSGPITLPNNTTYARLSINTQNNRPSFYISYSKCRKGNQSIFDKIKGFIDDYFSNDPTNIIEHFEDLNIINDTPISSLLLLPLNLLNSINTSLSTSCSSYTIPFDFTGGSNTLTFPCLNLQNYIGSNLWNVVDGLFCIFMFYNIAFLIIKFFEDWTSLRDTFDILFSSGRGGF